MPARVHRNVGAATAVQVLFVLFGIAIAAFFPFLALFLDERGLSPGQIGVVIAAMAAGRIAASPVWGHLADTSIGRRTTLQIGALGAAVAAVGLFLVEEYAAILVLGFVFATFSTTTGPNLDAIALEHLGKERMSEYGRIRGWESMSYAVSCLLIGFTLERTSPTWTMPIYAVASLAVLAWTVMEDVPRFATTKPLLPGSAARLMGFVNPVAAPEMIRIGAVLPFAVRGKTLMESPPAFVVTSSLLIGSTPTANGTFNPVAAPASVRSGATLPLAVSG